MGSLLDSVKLSDLVKGVDAWGEATVEAENLVLNHSSQGQVVKELRKLLPHLRVSILSETLVVKAIPTRERPRYIFTLG